MNIRTLQRQASVGIVLFIGLVSSAPAQVTVDRAWARATVANQTATGAFMRLTAQKDVQLIGARSPAAGVVEVHEMKMDGNIMRMRPIGVLPLKAGQPIELSSGGYHLMMMGLNRQIKAGDTVPLTLEFKAADGSVAKVEVQAVAAFTQPAP